jgi:hypothetical protein
MNINAWLDLYHSMIVRPINVNSKMGFLLTNSMRILFEDISLTDKSVQLLKRHYERIKV